MIPSKKIYVVGGAAGEYTHLTVSKTINGSSATVAVPIFRITGAVAFTVLGGKVTTALGSNHTAASFRINDQTTTTQLTSLAGVNLSSYVSSALILKTSFAGNALIGSNPSSNPARLLQTTQGGFQFGHDFIIDSKAGANTDIEYVYTTTNAPTSGVIEFVTYYRALTPTATVSAL